MQESLVQLRAAKVYRRRAAQTKAVTFVTGVGLVAGGVGLTATGVGESLLPTWACMIQGAWIPIIRAACHKHEIFLSTKHLSS
jgi:hypothetical protein